jgi:peptide chain release factor 2
VDSLRKRADILRTALDDALRQIKYQERKNELESLTTSSLQPDFWQDPKQAAIISKKQSQLSEILMPWGKLDSALKDITELISLGDESLLKDLEIQLLESEVSMESLKKELRFSGPYDSHDAILSIYAGAGGTDAQDWTAMLLRMYTRWAEGHSMKLQTINESAGEEAGLKTITIEISGKLAFGKLKGEHGVHRLVRLSPFNADSLRQTSFAKVEVLPKIEQPEEAGIDEKELKIDVYRSGGHGGQSVNTTDSAVRVTHLPTGLTVAIQNERSQLQNKETALTIIRSRLIQLKLEQHLEKLADIKGTNQSAEWGNQIRSYVLHPYKMVKDLRTNVETSDTDSVLNGNIDIFIDSFVASDN